MEGKDKKIAQSLKYLFPSFVVDKQKSKFAATNF
jgi:hypothetical protein|tara:strand:- start:360 stop:461 length:102 start_codon:yes stop_codon:yes gene_type:complete